MRLQDTLINSLALAIPFIRLITAADFCTGGLFRLRIYTKRCEGISVKIEGNDGPNMECGDSWGTEKEGIDGFPIIADVPIDREDILEPVKFWFNQGPKDEPSQKETECTLTFEEDPCVRNLVWKIGFGLDFTGPHQSDPYNLKGAKTLSLICEGDVDLWTPVAP